MKNLGGVLAFLASLTWGQFTNAQESPAVEYPITKTIAAIQADGLDIPEQTLTLEERDGWIVATLVAAPDELEWEIVVAKSTPGRVPRVEVHPTLPFYSVQYGEYFVRESLGRLRVYRQRKDFDDTAWSVIGIAPEGDKPCTAGRLFVVEEGQWYWACTAPRYDAKKIDARIRFQHLQLKKSHGSMMLADGQFAEVFCGDARCHDEGDLLVAQRMTGYGARAILAAEALESSLVGSPMPEITGKVVGDNKQRFTAEGFRGKVVLVDFWATWCGPCVEKLPVVEKLYEKYRDRGFAAVGVHSTQGADEVDAFLAQNPVSFPLALDDGGTQERFGVTAFPTYFLVGSEGKIVAGFQHDPPTEEQIEAELRKIDARPAVREP